MPVTIDELSVLASRARDLAAALRDAEARVSELKDQVRTLERDTLPEHMIAAGVTTVTIPASGNMPALSLKLKPFIKANIAASWPEERRLAAFAWLDGHGAGDLIKTEIVITFPREQREQAAEFAADVRDLCPTAAVEINEAVHHSTLTSWLKECVAAGTELPPLDTIGAEVGHIVEIDSRRRSY